MNRFSRVSVKFIDSQQGRLHLLKEVDFSIFFLSSFKQKEEIMDLLVQFYKEFKGFQDITYVSEVWLPEVSLLRTLLLVVFLGGL